jgi:putative membrane protein
MSTPPEPGPVDRAPGPDADRRAPDYRFSLANERTFLAWIRTALALVAGALALRAVEPELDRGMGFALPVACLVSAASIAAYSYRRWAMVESAMRDGAPLPKHPLLLPIAATIVAACVVVGVILFD